MHMSTKNPLTTVVVYIGTVVVTIFHLDNRLYYYFLIFFVNTFTTSVNTGYALQYVHIIINLCNKKDTSLSFKNNNN